MTSTMIQSLPASVHTAADGARQRISRSRAPQIRWGWATRALIGGEWTLSGSEGGRPRPGDVALVEIDKIGNHARIMTCDEGRMRLYPGDRLVGVMGERYATDAFEGEVDGLEELHILTSAGMLGTVRSKHHDTRSPTRVRFVSWLGDASGARLNLKDLLFKDGDEPLRMPPNILFTVGSGMNSGKTTTLAKLAADLHRQGFQIAACKLTGSVCHLDLTELCSTGAAFTCDFSDYGFPSTYRCDGDQLYTLFRRMMHDASQCQPDLVLVELADGVLQRETNMLLDDPRIRPCVSGILLSAPCCLSALQGVWQIEQRQHNVVAVSGIITNAPLFVREFEQESSIPVASVFNRNGLRSLAELVVDHISRYQPVNLYA